MPGTFHEDNIDFRKDSCRILYATIVVGRHALLAGKSDTGNECGRKLLTVTVELTKIVSISRQ
jgi:hypothetical protein